MSYNGDQVVTAKYVAVLIASTNNSEAPESVGSGYNVTTTGSFTVSLSV